MTRSLHLYLKSWKKWGLSCHKRFETVLFIRPFYVLNDQKWYQDHFELKYRIKILSKMVIFLIRNWPRFGPWWSSRSQSLSTGRALIWAFQRALVCLKMLRNKKVVWHSLIQRRKYSLAKLNIDVWLQKTTDSPRITVRTCLAVISDAWGA